MKIPEKKPPEKKPPQRGTGMLTERIELANPDPEQQPGEQAESAPGHKEEEEGTKTGPPAETGDQTGDQMLLPHERDQTTKPVGTSQPAEEELSREKIGQAAEDTRHGLVDTDRRGVPSDIIDSDLPAGGKKKKP